MVLASLRHALQRRVDLHGMEGIQVHVKLTLFPMTTTSMDDTRWDTARWRRATTRRGERGRHGGRRVNAPWRESSNYFWNKVIACETDSIALAVEDKNWHPRPPPLFSAELHCGVVWVTGVPLLGDAGWWWWLLDDIAAITSCSWYHHHRLCGGDDNGGGGKTWREKQRRWENLISLRVSFCGNWNWPEFNSIDYSSVSAPPVKVDDNRNRLVARLG